MQRLRSGIGVLLASVDPKNSFRVVGLDQHCAIVLRQKWSRGQIEARLAAMAPCPIGMEATGGGPATGLGCDTESIRHLSTIFARRWRIWYIGLNILRYPTCSEICGGPLLESRQEDDKLTIGKRMIWSFMAATAPPWADSMIR
jgi:hypothetical protein